MDEVFVYWDNSNIYYGAKDLAAQRERNQGGRYRIRLHFENLLQLAHADRPVRSALAAGAIPPEVRHLWDRMRERGVDVELYDRGGADRGEQQVPDRILQLKMLEDLADNNSSPGIAVLLTGDGAGYSEGTGFHSSLERMHRKGWRVEILSWAYCCKPEMSAWAKEVGAFIPLDSYYDSITYLEEGRRSTSLDLSRRPKA